MTTYTGTKSIKFWQNYINPTSGTLTSMVNNTNVGASASTPVAVNLTFSKGTSSFNAEYLDVGMIELLALDSSQNISGNTSNYVVKPAQFAITSILNNPAASAASGPVFVKAGNPFTVNVSVQNYAGNITPNYGKETSPAGIVLTANLIAPAGGRNGSLNNGAIGNGTAFTRTAPGLFSGTTFYYDEVGIISLTAGVASGNYLGAGNVTGPASGNVGRFIPHHFAANANIPIFNTGCNSGKFTYLNQAFTYNVAPVISITAEAVLNTTTQNYTGTFWKMIANNISTTYMSNSPTATLNSSAAAAAITVNAGTNGLGTIDLGDGGGIVFNKVNNTNIASFNAAISASITIQDADGVAYLANPFTIGSTQGNNGIAFLNGNTMLQGRISLSNNFGSELLPLTIPVTIQYFDGNDYITNTSDNCSSITNSVNLSLNPAPTTLTSTATIGNFVNGIGSIILSAPQLTGNTDVTLNLSVTGADLPYLQHNWPQGTNNGTFIDNPVARGTFGIYHGNDKIIYTQEVLN